jgi:xylan 1,4-beta-xylosidase
VTGQAEHDCDFISHHAYALSAHDRAVFPWLFPSVSNILQSVRNVFLDQRLVLGEARYALHLNECGLCGQYAWTKDDWAFLNIHNTHYAALFWAKLIVGLIKLADHPWCLTPELVAFWGAHEITGKMFSGNRSLATGGPLLKPVWSAFEMLARLGHTLLEVFDDLPDRIVGGLATRRKDGSAILLLYNFEEGVQPSGSVRSLTITVTGKLNGEVRHYLLDGEHGNTYTAWRNMGQPEDPTEEQLTDLRSHEALCQTVRPAVQRHPEAVELHLTLPAQSLNLIEIDLSRE